MMFQSEERLPMKFSKLVEFVSKKPIPPHVKHLVVEVMVSDEDGEDVEVFPILLQVKLLLTAISGAVHRCQDLRSRKCRVVQ